MTSNLWTMTADTEGVGMTLASVLLGQRYWNVWTVLFIDPPSSVDMKKRLTVLNSRLAVVLIAPLLSVKIN